MPSMNPVDPISGAALHAQGVRDVLVYKRDEDGALRQPPTTYSAASLSQALEGEQGFVVLAANDTRWDGVVEFIRPDAGRRAAPTPKVSALDDWSLLLSEAATPVATPPAQPLTPNVQEVPKHGIPFQAVDPDTVCANRYRCTCGAELKPGERDCETGIVFDGGKAEAKPPVPTLKFEIGKMQTVFDIAPDRVVETFGTPIKGIEIDHHPRTGVTTSKVYYDLHGAPHGQKMRDGVSVCHRTACQSANNVINAHIHTGHLYCTSCALALNLWSQKDHGVDIVKIPPEGQWLTTIPDDSDKPERFTQAAVAARVFDEKTFKSQYQATFEPYRVPEDMVERINQAIESQEQGHPFARSMPVVPAIEENEGAWSLDDKDIFPDLGPAPDISDITEDDVAEHSVPDGFAAEVTATVRNRGTDYGTPATNHQLTADLWSSWLSRKWGEHVTLTAEDVCMLNVLQKLSRLANGTKDDSWLDVAGYTENVAMLRPDQRNTR